MVDKVVCERRWLTKMVWKRWCVKDGVLKIVVDKVVCERRWLTKLCVKEDGV